MNFRSKIILDLSKLVLKQDQPLFSVLIFAFRPKSKLSTKQFRPVQNHFGSIEHSGPKYDEDERKKSTSRQDETRRDETRQKIILYRIQFCR